MRRPFNVMVLLDTRAEYLHELTTEALSDLTKAMQMVIKSIHVLLPDLGREISYNLALHSGPNNHVYAEFFPMVQTTGGFERIGLWICQLSAEHAAAQLRAYIEELT
jgi:galactose-1-phosphate uridylyltransferase